MGVYTYDKENDELKRIAGYTIYSAAPIGAIMPFGGETSPYGWLMCQGQAVSRTDYADLFSVIGTAYGEGDGSTTFNLPDLREATTKGVGLSGKSSNHYDTDGIALGEFIDDRIQSHTHSVTLASRNTVSGSNTGGFWQNTAASTTGAVNSVGTRTGNTTEVKAVGVNYIIKALVVPTDADQSVIDELGEVKNSVANKLNKNTTVQGVITAQPVTYRSFTLTDTNNMQHGYQPHCLLLISREEVILVNVRIHSTDIAVEATKITGGNDNITALAYTVDNTAHSITFYATLGTWAMVFAVQKITIQDIQPSSVSKIDSIPDNVTSLEIKNTVTRGTCTLDSAVTSGGNITWVKSGKVVTLRVNLGASGTIPQNATIATGAPKALTATTGIAVTSTGAAKMLQVDTSGVVTHTNGGGILTSTQLYGDITYITSE